MKKLIKNSLRTFSFLIGHKTTTRSEFLSSIRSDQKVLEIGPFCNPDLRGSNVAYFDVLNREDLIKRAVVERYPISDKNAIPEIDYVSPTGDLSIINDRFDQVYSAHCIEHQPDLIKHLQDVSSLLNPGGHYYLTIPDKRYCFDSLLPESDIASVVEAYQEKSKTHRLSNVIRYYSLTTHNSAIRHWLFWHGKHTNTLARIKQGLNAYGEAEGGYMDVHAWQFTPDSFAKIMKLLHEMNLIDLVVSVLNQTAIGSNEFYVVLQKRG